ncbi:hypothetical protein GPJ56_000136 [Histomonas meleagridis]|uniref:uncharacterized protein n=1 Tax=Histomonas meleagridis TaxID=135588 RepID=UPI003559F0A6|nr:hypothetical protein GPJ56_000136 [Histomonas meleagridis]KAH0805635.1 hypothetical protein GO595_001690 [Histomonas meleagridis]
MMFDDFGNDNFLQFPQMQNEFDYDMNLSPESIPEFNPMDSFEDLSVSINGFEEDDLITGWSSLKQEQPIKIKRKKVVQTKNVSEISSDYKEIKPMILRPFESCQATETSVIYLRMWSNQMFGNTENHYP